MNAALRLHPQPSHPTKFSVASSRRWEDTQSNEWKEETDMLRLCLDPKDKRSWQQQALACRTKYVRVLRQETVSSLGIRFGL